MICIYKILNPKNKIYVGQTGNWDKRLNHYNKLYCKGQPKLYYSLKKYGPENHTFEIIEECSIEQLDEKEIFWGNYYEVLNNNGLNCKELGKNGKHSPKTNKKISSSLKGRDISAWKHKIYTKERNQKISMGNKNVPKPKGGKFIRTEEYWNKLRKPRSQKAKENMSKARMGYKPTKKHIENMRFGMIGKNIKPIICIDTNIKYSSIKEASILLNINPKSISNNVLGYSKTSNKLTFKYIHNELP